MHWLCDKTRIRLYMTRHDSQNKKGPGLTHGGGRAFQTNLTWLRLGLGFRVSHTGLGLELVLR